MSRQVGKDFSTSAEAVADCMQNSGVTWMYAAPSERQSYEGLQKCKEWAEAFNFSIADILEERPSPGALFSNATVIFPNKSRIICVPGKPDTVRGFSANVILTEFAFFEDPDATWKAILPSVTNPLRGGEKRVRIISTPNGKSGRGARFYRIVSDPKTWSVHKVTIEDAVRDGLLVNIAELRAAIDDENAWAQEFMCEFLDSSNCLLPYDIIALAESADASTHCDPALFAPESKAHLFLGIDFGRTNDPTVCWTLERVGDVFWTREVLVLRDTSTPDQQAALDVRIRRARRVCFDYTGPGIGLGDYLAKDHGTYDPKAHKFGRMELCTFTSAFKRELFPRLRRAFEAPVKLRVPVDVECREDLHEMQQIVKNGEYTYAARRTAEGHSDRCTALALAWRAAGTSRGRIFVPRTFDQRMEEAVMS
jgi:phage FluMu gp28-like protein